MFPKYTDLFPKYTDLFPKYTKNVSKVHTGSSLRAPMFPKYTPGFSVRVSKVHTSDAVRYSFVGRLRRGSITVFDIEKSALVNCVPKAD